MPTLPPSPSPGYEPDDDALEPTDAGIDVWPSTTIEVLETDNPIVGTLYDANGGVLVELRERRTVPFGYRR